MGFGERKLVKLRNQVGTVVSTLVVGLALSSSADAAHIVPAGLSAGDPYRIVFVTAGLIDAVSDDVADYNDFVANEALLDPELAALNTTWSALISTESVNAKDNAGLDPLDATTPFYNTEGELLAVGVVTPGTGLYGGSSTAHLELILLAGGGKAGMPLGVWTGTEADGDTSSCPVGGSGGCLLEVQYATWGSASAKDSAWTDWDDGFVANSLRVYGISGVLIATPEPSTVLLTLLGVMLLGLGKAGRARK